MITTTVTRTGTIEYNGKQRYIEANLRLIDFGQGGYFSVTGQVGRGVNPEVCGCIHDEIIEAFPDLAKYIKWHLFYIEKGPFHYIANSLYYAGWTKYIDVIDIDLLRKQAIWGVLEGDNDIDLQSLINKDMVPLTDENKDSRGMTLKKVLEARLPHLIKKMNEEISQLFV
jgi:hypothetical protein